MRILYVVIGGAARVGKDTAGNIVRKFANERGLNTIVRSFASPIKETVTPTGNKEEDRINWQKFGDTMRQRFGDGIFADILFNRVKEYAILNTRPDIVIVPDLRLLGEIEAMKNTIGSRCLFIKVKASDEMRRKRFGEEGWAIYNDRCAGDKTEIELNSIPESSFDAVIENNGNVEELEKKLILVIDEKMRVEGIQ